MIRPEVATRLRLLAQEMDQAGFAVGTEDEELSNMLWECSNELRHYVRLHEDTSHVN